MNWDLFGLLDQGEKDEQKRILAEQLAQRKAKRQARAENTTTKEPETKKSQI